MPLTYTRPNQPTLYTDVILPSSSTDSTVDVTDQHHQQQKKKVIVHGEGTIEGRNGSSTEPIPLTLTPPTTATASSSLSKERLSNPFRKTSPHLHHQQQQQQLQHCAHHPREVESWRGKDILNSSIFKEERDSTIDSSLEIMWTIRRCYAFDEDDDDIDVIDDCEDYESRCSNSCTSYHDEL